MRTGRPRRPPEVLILSSQRRNPFSVIFPIVPYFPDRERVPPKVIGVFPGGGSPAEGEHQVRRRRAAAAAMDPAAEAERN